MPQPSEQDEAAAAKQWPGAGRRNRGREWEEEKAARQSRQGGGSERSWREGEKWCSSLDGEEELSKRGEKNRGKKRQNGGCSRNSHMRCMHQEPPTLRLVLCLHRIIGHSIHYIRLGNLP